MTDDEIVIQAEELALLSAIRAMRAESPLRATAWVQWISRQVEQPMGSDPNPFVHIALGQVPGVTVRDLLTESWDVIESKRIAALRASPSNRIAFEDLDEARARVRATAYHLGHLREALDAVAENVVVTSEALGTEPPWRKPEALFTPDGYVPPDDDRRSDESSLAYAQRKTGAAHNSLTAAVGALEAGEMANGVTRLMTARARITAAVRMLAPIIGMKVDDL